MLTAEPQLHHLPVAVDPLFWAEQQFRAQLLSVCLDWNYMTTSQTGLNGHAIPYPRGLVRSTSYMAYATDDFNRCNSYQRPGLLVRQPHSTYMRKVQADSGNYRMNGSFLLQTTTGQFNPGVHGFNGINSVSLNSFPSRVDFRIIETTTQLTEFSIHKRPGPNRAGIFRITILCSQLGCFKYPVLNPTWDPTSCPTSRKVGT
ncbi:hypothetical protein C8R44DRAFT_753296 [Mycena epipterygia]|nr:hypothetical protein C8R44DRAFT_753296 [Mycena epipterygia]